MKHTNKRRILSLLLALAMVISMLPVGVFAAEETATLVTDVTTLAAGDQIVLVAAEQDYALSTNQKSNNRAATAVTKTENTVTVTSDVQVLTLENSTLVENAFALSTGEGYLYAASSTKNYLRTEAELSANSSWLISISDTGVATLTAQGEFTRNLLRYNPNNGSPIFSCYGSGQQDVCIYKLDDAGTEPTEPSTEPTEPSTEPSEPVGGLPFGDGAEVVIYVPAYGKALSATKTGNYNVGVDVALTEGVLSGYGESEIWTVIDNGDGTWSFANGGQNIGMADEYTSMNLGAIHDDWSLTDLGDGMYNIKNVGRDTFMEWYAKYSNWSTYNSSYAATDDQFQLAFYVIPGNVDPEPTDPTDPEPSEPDEPAAPIADGDQVVIYAPAHGKALSATKTGNYNVGVDVALTEGVLSGYGESEIWTVIDNGDGTWSFANGGQNIGMADEYTSMNLGAIHDDWSLTDLGDGLYNIKNVGRDTFMEWYAKYSNWSTYNSSYAATDDQFQLAFYVIPGNVDPEPTEPTDPTNPEPSEPDEPAAPIADGDQVVIYAPAYGKALSATKTGNYNVGVDVALTEGVLSGYGESEIWTVIDNGDGTWSFANGGQNIGMADEYTSMNLGAIHDDWSLTDLGDGLYNIKNVGRDTFMEWYAKYSNWSTYNSSYAATDDQFQLAFYVIPGNVDPEPTYPTDPTDPEPSEPDEPAAPIADGDQVVIYAPAYGKALSATKTGNYNVGVDVALAEGVLSGYGESEIWTVIDNGDGTWSFANGGQNIGMADEYTSMNLGAIHDDWSLTDLGDGLYNIKNVGRDTFMEWYAKYSNWSTYNSSYAATDDQFQLAFYVIPGNVDPEPTGKITSADQFVTGTYVMVVEGNYAMSVLNGNWVDVVQPVIENGVVTDAKGGIWTLSVDGTNVQITDSNGASIKPKGGNNNGIASGSYDWAWSFDEATQTFTFTGQGSDTVTLASNASEDATYGGFHRFRGYKTKTVTGNPEGYPSAFTLYKVDTTVLPDEDSKPAAGDQVVLYNLGAKGVLAAENDTQSIENALTEIVDGKAIPANGGVVFTVEIVDGYYRFWNDTYGYLCSNGTGNNAFYAKDASEDADWTLLAGKSGGWNLESRTAKFNGTYSQYLEYYADCYKTYSMYNVTDFDIYEFVFYPVSEDVNLSGGIVNVPDVIFGNNGAAYLGMDYTYTFSIDAIFGVDTLRVAVNGVETEYVYDEVLGVYTVTVPAERIREIFTESGFGVMSISISGVDNTGMQFGNGGAIDIIDEPSIGVVTPAANAETKEDKRPVISVELVNVGEAPNIVMTVNGEDVEAFYENGMIIYTPAEDLADGRTTVSVTVTRGDGKEASKTWSFTVGEAQYALYFGQLHSHTTYSDGSGSLESALNYIASLPESANVDFVAFTDHSNYFDASGAANPEDALYDMTLATADSQKLWAEYVTAMKNFNAEQSDVIAVPGFEMTWSGGPGHINTFNTPGIVSRNNTTLNNKTSDAGMKAYYALLSRAEGVDSISQFNHPGSTFGTFSDFAYWDALIDSRIQLVEVGNGEGQIGAGGYYPSYEYYTMALDKGWHVAPTNNQDNHKGKWGNANDARDVILTDDFSEEGIYAAIRAMRMYATEDKNLEIGYSVNGLMLGSTIEEVPEKLNFEITVYDPDASDSISKVELIVNSGKVAYTWDDPADLADGALAAELAPDYSYYYLRVTEGDGDLAVTAPVWVGEMLKLGISSVETATSTPVTDEELTITTTLFNSEAADATVKSLVYTIGDQVIGTDTAVYQIPASSNKSVEFKYIPTAAKLTKVTVTAIVELEGVEYTFNMDIELDVQDASKLVYIGIDASHYNEYVNGNYKDSMGNFSNLAAEYGVRTVTLKTSEELVAACNNEKYVALILTAPSRRSAEAQAADPLLVYTQEELECIKAFNAKGGTVILAGWSDHYENYPNVASIANMKAEEHMAATQNAVLEALGSSLRIGDDATYDDTYNGGQAYRLYFNTYGDSFLTDGVEVDPEHPHDRMYTEVFSHYGGASVYTVDGTLSSTVTPVVFGHSGTYSVDVDKDGLGGSNMYKYAVSEGDERLMIMASEQLEGQGLIIVSGAAFMSNFEVQATIEDSGSEKNYSNYKVCENLLAYLNPVTVTDIAEVRAQTDVGYKYTIEGVVTSNASGYDKDTAFFDCIYVQDATGGICCFPVAGNYKIGDLVRITGTTEYYQGEPELQVESIEVIGEAEVNAETVTAAQINDRSVEGKLVKLEGIVESYELANGLVQTIMVKDLDGSLARVFIDGYITTAEDVKELAVGNTVTVTGLASYDDTFNAPEGPFPRIRVRDRADVVCTKVEHTHSYTETVTAPTCTEGGYTTYTCACGHSYTGNETAALGHTAQILPGKAATCTETGLTEGKKCSVCGEILVAQEEIAKLAHTEVIIPGKPATETETGLTEGKKCSVCGQILVEQTVIDKLEPEKPCDGDESCPAHGFEDVDKTEWYHEAVDYVIEEGLMKGTGIGFEPAAATTRAQLATMLWRLAGEPTGNADTKFEDLDKDQQWYQEAVKWAAAKGIVNGRSETVFDPNANVTRQEMVTMFYRFAKVMEIDLSAKGGLDKFVDEKDVMDYAAEPMTWAVGAGLIRGNVIDGVIVLNPLGDTTRAQMATVLMRYIEQIAK